MWVWHVLKVASYCAYLCVYLMKYKEELQSNPLMFQCWMFNLELAAELVVGIVWERFLLCWLQIVQRKYLLLYCLCKHWVTIQDEIDMQRFPLCQAKESIQAVSFTVLSCNINLCLTLLCNHILQHTICNLEEQRPILTSLRSCLFIKVLNRRSERALVNSYCCCCYAHQCGASWERFSLPVN